MAEFEVTSAALRVGIILSFRMIGFTCRVLAIAAFFSNWDACCRRIRVESTICIERRGILDQDRCHQPLIPSNQSGANQHTQQELHELQNHCYRHELPSLNIYPTSPRSQLYYCDVAKMSKAGCHCTVLALSTYDLCIERQSITGDFGTTGLSKYS